MATKEELKTLANNQQLAKPTTISGMLDRYKDQIARALPRHMTADRLARVALTECRKTPALMRCKPESLFGAVIQAAQLGLEPGGALGHCYLIPFGQEVQFIVGYRGMIDLARRSGQIVSLEAHAVYEGDKFECAFGLESDLKHVPDWENPNRANADKLRFVYAVAKLKDGGIQFEVMSRAEVDAIRSRSKASKFGPWVTDYVAMALKTVIRRLFKYLPVSIELQVATNLDERAEADLPQENWENVIDGDVVQDVSFQPEEETVNTETGEVSPPAINPAVIDYMAVIEGITSKSDISRTHGEIKADKRLSQAEKDDLTEELKAKQATI